MADEYELFKNYLSNNDLKLTLQRRAVLKAVFAAHHHFDAEELADGFRYSDEKISRATVYRTLDLLVKAGLIHSMELGESRKIYEHIFGHKHHDHLVCTLCGRTIEFDNDFIESLQEEICENLNFRAQTHSLRIFGVCGECP